MANATVRKPARRGGPVSKRRMKAIAIAACVALVALAAFLIVLYLNQSYCFLC